MTDTYLGSYAALQKRNAVTAVLDFKGEEWETLQRLKVEDMAGGWDGGRCHRQRQQQ